MPNGMIHDSGGYGSSVSSPASDAQSKFPYHNLFFIFVDDEAIGGEEQDAEDRLLFFYPSRFGEAERLRRLTIFGAVECFRFQLFAHLQPAAPAQPAVMRFENGAPLAIVALGKYRLAFGGYPHVPDLLMEHRAHSLLDALRFYNGPLPAYFARIEATFEGPALKTELARMALEVLPLLQDTVQHRCPFHAVDALEHCPLSQAAFLQADQYLASLPSSGQEVALALLHDRSVVCSNAPRPDLLKWVVNCVPEGHGHRQASLPETPFGTPLGPEDWEAGRAASFETGSAEARSSYFKEVILPGMHPPPGGFEARLAAASSQQALDSECTGSFPHDPFSGSFSALPKLVNAAAAVRLRRSSLEQAMVRHVWLDGPLYRELMEDPIFHIRAMATRNHLFRRPGATVESPTTASPPSSAESNTALTELADHLREVAEDGGRWLGLVVHTSSRLSLAMLMELPRLYQDPVQQRLQREFYGSPTVRQLEATLQHLGRRLKALNQSPAALAPVSDEDDEERPEDSDAAMWLSPESSPGADHSDFSEAGKVSPLLPHWRSVVPGSSVLLLDAFDETAQGNGPLTWHFLEALALSRQWIDDGPGYGRLYLGNGRGSAFYAQHAQGLQSHFHFRNVTPSQRWLERVEARTREMMEVHFGKLLL
eukprot:EG_transcript_5498